MPRQKKKTTKPKTRAKKVASKEAIKVADTKAQPAKKSSYSAKDITVLEGLDPVRKRPGMYIGGTGLDGLHHLVWEVVDNSIDEAMAGFCTEIVVILHKGHQVTVTDNGRGIPVEMHKVTKKSALETVMCTLHAGGKFGGEGYKVSGGLHGVGVSVVNALSSKVTAEIKRDGFVYTQEYERGKAKGKVKKGKHTKETGTAITFDPDPEIFKQIEFSWKKIVEHLRQQAYLTKNVRVKIIDERELNGKSKELVRNLTFYFEGGIKSYLDHLNEGEKVVHETPFYVEKEIEDITVEIALQYTDEIKGLELSFANNIHTGEGGTHVMGFRSALTRTINDYARKNDHIKAKEENLSGDDVREGLSAVISVKLRDPQFEGQTKAKLGNAEMRTAVQSVMLAAFSAYLEEHPQEARQIMGKCMLAQKARKAAKAAKDTVIRKGAMDGLTLPGKLADCSSRKPEECELYIVEGDSAGGCFSGDTKVALVDGRDLSFRKLVKEHQQGKKNYCYTLDSQGHTRITLIKEPRLTKRDAEVIKVILDNGEGITCTPDHKFRTAAGRYIQAKNLTTSVSLAPLYRKRSKIEGRITIDGYEMVFDAASKRWVFTHLLADKHNLKNEEYSKKDGLHRHHIDFNKLNNSPENICRMNPEEHLKCHQDWAFKTMLSEEGKEKSRQAHQSEEYREKIRRIMSTPAMKKILSKRAKRQWENEGYKEYMKSKFLDFYNSNEEYRKESNQRLNQAQKDYWAKGENRQRRSREVTDYYKDNPQAKEELSLRAAKQWEDEDLLNWRKEKTKQQWTSEFRKKRKVALDKTYYRKSIGLMNKLHSEGKLDDYEMVRIKSKDKSLLSRQTFVDRYFAGDSWGMFEAVKNHNHKIKKIVKLKKKIDVYDLEVSETHNFALASGVFVHNSAKQGRDRGFQAIFPLRGKILNIERARLDKVLSSKEIKSLIIALGTGVGEEMDLSKLRYHRIIIMTDADVDGAHIRTLLLTLFYRHFEKLVEDGYLYIAQPPLYKVQVNKKSEYAFTDQDKNEVLDNYKKEIKQGAKVSLQRYKGLGEMNPGQLWETTMDPENRMMYQVKVDDAAKADRVFDTLMGAEVAPRRKFIQTHAQNVKNLDI
ncbi:DNA topoisomerase (ATP-hydrolyzing) subunit B [Patescibacteria group bacterium]|nr:DNA topoisomerase (ATP-hydrolyzing) subunit B [Patescibacteria group bacterium]